MDKNDPSHSSGCVIGLGNIAAAILSYHLWGSFWWMLLHFFLGWIYVVYFLITHYC